MGGFQALSQTGNEIEILNESFLFFLQICLQFVYYLFSNQKQPNRIGWKFWSNDIIKTKVPQVFKHFKWLAQYFIATFNNHNSSMWPPKMNMLPFLLSYA